MDLEAVPVAADVHTLTGTVRVQAPVVQLPTRMQRGHQIQCSQFDREILRALHRPRLEKRRCLDGGDVDLSIHERFPAVPRLMVELLRVCVEQVTKGDEGV